MAAAGEKENGAGFSEQQPHRPEAGRHVRPEAVRVQWAQGAGDGREVVVRAGGAVDGEGEQYAVAADGVAAPAPGAD
jgi:hypothetical protein